jgi:carbonic anhydrase/acetyltransferase-like protein (isoleucine patch superfamily)
MEKKYEFTGEILEHEGVTLKRIRRISDGLVGGWLQSEDNLSHEGGCFVYDNAKVYHFAKVFDNARVYGNARVYENAQVYHLAIVYGNARVYENAQVSSFAKVFDNAMVYKNAQVYGYAKVFNSARVSGNARVYGTAWVSSNAKIYHDAIVRGNTEITKSPIFLKDACEFPITAYNEFIQVGCILHTKKEWQDYIDRKEWKYLDRCDDVKSHDKCVEVLKSIINGKIV